MLSAIAARKAAQAARQSQDNGLESSQPTPATLSSSPVTSADSTPPPSRPTSKRKSSSQTPRPAKRKRKEKEKQPRYFSEGAASVALQQDVIIVDSDQDQELLSDAEDSAALIAERRAWSPSVPVNDSSDEEGEDVADVSLSVLPQSRKPAPTITSTEEPPVLSTFEPRLDENMFDMDSAHLQALGISSSSGGVLLALAPSETICLLGTYSFTVLHGAVNVAGVTIASSKTEHKVFAPRSAPIPSLEGVASNSSAINPEKLPRHIAPLLDEQSTLVLVKELRTGVEGLGHVCRTFDGVFAPSRYSRAAVISAICLPGVVMLSHQTRDTQAFELPLTWKSALSAKILENSASVHFVKGPKNSGKSTFCRTLVNNLLSSYQRVAYLDCDLGQSEFTPGGMVSLNVIESPIFGPAYTHPTLPLRAHFIGDTSPRSSPSHYIDSIQSLLEFYKLDVQTPASILDEHDARISEFIPLVVNTMGWNKGLGADLTSKIQEMATPTHVYEFDSPMADPSWNFALPAEDTPGFPASSPLKTFKLEPIPTSVLATNWSAADHRAITLLSYLHAVFPKPSSDELAQLTTSAWNTALPLCARPPYEVDAATALDRVVLTGAGSEDVVPSELWRVLNGALIGLVSCEPGAVDDSIAEPMSAPGSLPYVQGGSVPSPAMSRCHGLALVRSAAASSPQIQLLTPVPVRYLGESRVIVKGELELPIWGMLDHRSEGDDVAGVDGRKVPYLQWGKGEGLGGEKRRVRRNLMRRAQM